MNATITQRPFVLVNMAMTADGKIATANRAVSSFGSEHDREHLLALRATADAVMAGARTVDLNRINLGPGPARFRQRRLKRGLAEFNLRIIVSGSGSINPRAEIFKRPFATQDSARILLRSPSGGERVFAGRVRGLAATKSPIIILTTRRAGAARIRRLRTLANAVFICGRREINFHHALRWLRQGWGVTRLLCEGGGELNDALFRASLVDELHLTICPKIFGGGNAPTIADGDGVARLARAAQWHLKSRRRVGDELFLVFAK